MVRSVTLTRAAAIRFAAACAGLALLGHEASAEVLSGDRLKSFISGKRVYIAVPLGGEIPLNYRPGV